MRVSGMLCRSQAVTAVCGPGDARSMVVARRRADRTTVAAEDARALHDVRYARLGGDQQCRSTSRRFAAVASGTPPLPPLREARPRRRGSGRAAPVAVTMPMVTMSPVREAPARELAAKRAPDVTTADAAAAAAPPGDQVLQVVVMKVAIHCQGCAGKVRKHISKMEGSSHAVNESGSKEGRGSGPSVL